MKAILASIRPQHVANILNGLKTIEVRKKFPKDYVGWVYIYVTRNRSYLYHERTNIGSYDFYELTPDGVQDLPNYKHAYTVGHDLNGKVVARFWCDKVEEIACEQLDNGVGKDTFFYTDSITDINKDSCLDTQDLINYLGAKSNGDIVGKAIHITKLEIFDKPREISEFYKVGYNYKLMFALNTQNKVFRERRVADVQYDYKLTRAPQSYCFIEVDL